MLDIETTLTWGILNYLKRYDADILAIANVADTVLTSISYGVILNPLMIPGITAPLQTGILYLSAQGNISWVDNLNNEGLEAAARYLVQTATTFSSNENAASASEDVAWLSRITNYIALLLASLPSTTFPTTYYTADGVSHTENAGDLAIRALPPVSIGGGSTPDDSVSKEAHTLFKTIDVTWQVPSISGGFLGNLDP